MHAAERYRAYNFDACCTVVSHLMQYMMSQLDACYIFRVYRASLMHAIYSECTEPAWCMLYRVYRASLMHAIQSVQSQLDACYRMVSKLIHAIHRVISQLIAHYRDWILPFFPFYGTLYWVRVRIPFESLLFFLLWRLLAYSEKTADPWQHVEKFIK